MFENLRIRTKIMVILAAPLTALLVISGMGAPEVTMMKRAGNDRLRVRPYAITGGRTRPTTDIAIEAMVVRSKRGLSLVGRVQLEKGAILDLLEKPLSVAEISAHSRLPLGVVRVLVGDMSEDDLVIVNSPTRVDGRPNLKLLERVFDGLQAL